MRQASSWFGKAIVLVTFVSGGAAPVRGELVARWSLDQTLGNSAQLRPDAVYFQLDEDAATPALEPPPFVAGPPTLQGAQAISLDGPRDPDGNGRFDGSYLTVYEDEAGIAKAAESLDWTLTGWFRIDPDPAFAATAGGQGAAGLFLNGDAGSGQTHQFGLGLQATAEGGYGLVYHAAGKAEQATAFDGLVEDVWYFAAQVSDELHDTLSVYLWDSRSASSELLAADTVGVATPLWLERVFEMEIGWDVCCGDRLFDGAIADVRLYNEGLSVARLRDLIEPGAEIAGDLNGDGSADAWDIDLLSAAIRAGRTDARFDLDMDGQVDAKDRSFWVEQIKQTWMGDSTLDGVFDSGDLVSVFQVGLFEDDVPLNAGWAEGDWDGDGDFGTADFVVAFTAGGFEQGPRAAGGGLAAVPEPSTGGGAGLAGLCLAWFIRRRHLLLVALQRPLDLQQPL